MPDRTNAATVQPAAAPVGGGPGGSSLPPPAVQITSPGREPGASGDDPDYLQGSAYTLTWQTYVPQAPSDPDGDPGFTGYKLDAVEEDFPQGAIKGYGTFSEQNGDPRGPHLVFTGGPTDSDGTAVQAVTSFDAEDTTETDLVDMPGQSMINTFYFGPEAQGTVQVGVKLTFKEYNQGTFTGSVTIGDTRELAVEKPTGVINVVAAAQNADVGVTPPLGQPPNTSQVLLMNKNYDVQRWAANSNDAAFNVGRVDAPNVGIRWDASVTLPSGSAQGVFGIVQTLSSDWVETYDTATYKWLLAPPFYQPSAPVAPIRGALDTSFPYSTAYAVGSGGKVSSATASPGQHLIGQDTPSAGLPNVGPNGEQPQKVTRQDRFVSTLMYNPGGDNNSVWIPIASLSWGWNGQANYNAQAVPAWSGDGVVGIPAASTPAQNNGGFPQWNRNAKFISRYPV